MFSVLKTQQTSLAGTIYNLYSGGIRSNPGRVVGYLE
jgi:hypothetical protein